MKIAEFTLLLDCLLLSMPRMVSFMLFIPMFQEQIVPASIKLALAAVFAMIPAGIYFYDILDGVQKIPSGPMYYAIIIKETIIGSVFSFLIGLAFRIPSMVGDFIDNQRGTAISQMYNPALGEQSSELAQFLSHFFITWFVTVGGLISMMSVLFLSYKVLPVSTFILDFHQLKLGLFFSIIENYLRLFIIMAAPFMLGMLLLEFGMGIMNRFANQLNVFFLAQPLKSLLALFIFTIFIALMVRIFQSTDQFFAPIHLFLDAVSGKNK